jgi:hypothetical protein
MADITKNYVLGFSLIKTEAKIDIVNVIAITNNDILIGT